VKVIDNNKELVVTNLDQLPRGTGAKYLEVIESHCGTYIAKQWRRKLNNVPDTAIVIWFR